MLPRFFHHRCTFEDHSHTIWVEVFCGALSKQIELQFLPVSFRSDFGPNELRPFTPQEFSEVQEKNTRSNDSFLIEVLELQPSMQSPLSRNWLRLLDSSSGPFFIPITSEPIPLSTSMSTRSVQQSTPIGLAATPQAGGIL
jgi:hypothetical protein